MRHADLADLDEPDALERELVDLGAHLDEPDGADLATAVVRAVRTDARSPAKIPAPRRPSARLLLVAATVTVVVVGLLAFAPARQAIAELFGIGTVEIKNDAVPPTTGGQPIPGAPGTASAPGPAPATVHDVSLDEARRQLAFRVRVPSGEGVGQIDQASIDDRAPGGLLAVSYPGFTVVEVASPLDEAPVAGKSVPPGTRVQPVGVYGHPGAWLEGDPHSVGYLDRDGHLRSDTVRRAGNVLVWTADGATYRLEGVADLSGALALAASMMTS